MNLKDNRYLIQGVDVLDICREFGTPLYVYDAEKIEKQIKTLKRAFSEVDLKIKYACKALTNISVLKLVRRSGAGIDVVSMQEGQLALGAGYSSDEILFTPSSVDFEELKEAVKLGFTVNLDSFSVLKKFGETFRNSYPCCIRLNPHIMAGGNYKISTGHSNSKFGISVYQLPQIMEVVKKYDIKVNGLHIHTGSDITDTDVFLKMADIFFGVARDFPDLQFLDFGSGFKVAYKEGDITTNVYDLGLRLSKVFNEFCEQYGRKLQLWIEPGKFIVSESGHFFVKTNVVKETPTVTFAGVNSGLNHLIRPMMYDAHHDILNVSNPQGAKKLYTVVGYICETDTFGADRILNEVNEGDVLAFKNAGAYGYMMASNYNSRYRPAEVMVIDGVAKLIRKRETFDDLIKGQIDIGI